MSPAALTLGFGRAWKREQPQERTLEGACNPLFAQTDPTPLEHCAEVLNSRTPFEPSPSSRWPGEEPQEPSELDTHPSRYSMYLG